DLRCGAVCRGPREPRRDGARQRAEAPAPPAPGADAVTDPIRVLLVDDDALVRAGLSMLLAGADDVRVVGEAADGSDVAAAVAEHQPDVVLMDIRMPGMDGLSATELLREREDARGVVVLTPCGGGDCVPRARRGGEGGFRRKDPPRADMVRAIGAGAAGEPMLSPTVTRRLIGHVTESEADERQRRAREQLDRLTEREREVAVAVGLGNSDAEISRDLYMSFATVQAHLSRVFEELELDN